MSECKSLTTCSFVKFYENSKGNDLALKGFINSYCKGQKQDDCKRKKVSRNLGGPLYVPPNMMPNGMPLVGTNSDQWPKDVKALV
jgi:hypothetical protein